MLSLHGTMEIKCCHHLCPLLKTAWRGFESLQHSPPGTTEVIALKFVIRRWMRRVLEGLFGVITTSFSPSLWIPCSTPHEHSSVPCYLSHHSPCFSKDTQLLQWVNGHHIPGHHWPAWQAQMGFVSIWGLTQTSLKSRGVSVTDSNSWIRLLVFPVIAPSDQWLTFIVTFIGMRFWQQI